MPSRPTVIDRTAEARAVPPQLRTARRSNVLALSLAFLSVIIWAAGVMTPSPVSAQGPAGPSLRADPARSQDGVYQLEWSRPGSVRLEEARRPDFSDAVVVYEGADQATTLTGRNDGTYYYRLRAADRPLAADRLSTATPEGEGAAGSPAAEEAVRVEVHHHPLGRALAFFATGFVVFGATVWLVVAGDRSALLQEGAEHG